MVFDPVWKSASLFWAIMIPARAFKQILGADDHELDDGSELRSMLVALPQIDFEWLQT